MSFIRLFVRLSVTLVDQDHIGWKSWKLIAKAISPSPSLFLAQRPSTYSQRTWGNFGTTRGGMGKVAAWSTKAAISLKRVKIDEEILCRAYRNSNSPTLFRTNGTISDPQRAPLPKDWWFATLPQNCNRYYLRKG